MPWLVSRFSRTLGTLIASGVDGKLKKCDLVLLASVGAGFTAGATLLRWAY